jgi:hypothetical protein
MEDSSEELTASRQKVGARTPKSAVRDPFSTFGERNSSIDE